MLARARQDNIKKTTAQSQPLFWTVGALSALVLMISGLLTYEHWSGPVCLFRRYLRVPCPGCGLTRSFAALWRGDVTGSLHYHPLGMPLFLMMWAGTILSLACHWLPAARRLSQQWEETLRQPNVWRALLALWLGTWFARLVYAWAGNRGCWW